MYISEYVHVSAWTGQKRVFDHVNLELQTQILWKTSMGS